MVKKRGVAKKGKKKEQFSFKKEYWHCWGFLKDSRHYIYIILLLFLIFGALGFFFEGLIDQMFKALFNMNLNEQILGYLEKLLLETQGMNQRELIGFIFLNNFQSSLTGFLFGAIYGIFPLFATIINGYLLGFVGILSVKQEGILVLWRILPHGIFELPAVFISLALGLRFGDDLLRKSRDFGKSFLYLLFVFAASFLVFGAIMFVFSGISSFFNSGTYFFSNPLAAGNSFLVFLIFAVLLAIMMLLGIRILDVKDQKEIRNFIVGSLKVLLLVIIPLLIIAAIIEGTLIVLAG